MAQITVIIPTFNRALHLQESVESVLNQKFQELEILIIDDGSKDTTNKIVSELSNRFPGKIKYFFQENNGPASARNKGIKEARGEYIAFLDSDDLWLPQKLEKSINFLNQNNFDWICTACFKVYKNNENKKNETRYIQKDFLDSSGTKINLLKNGLFFFSSVPLYTCSILAKRECFKKVGLFDERFKVGEDTDMWLRFEEAGLSGGYLNEPLFTYRTVDSSITKSKRSICLTEHIRLAKKHAVLLGLHKLIIRSSYSNFLWKCADLALETGEYLIAAKCLLRGLIIYPEVNKLRKLLRFIKRKTISHEYSY